MRRRELLKTTVAGAVGAMLAGGAEAQAPGEFESGRRFWLAQVEQVAGPLLGALSEGRLKATMPVECAAGMEASRRHTTYLEGFARTLSGIAPWLEHGAREGEEGALRGRYVEMAQRALGVGIDPGAADYLEFGVEQQSLVDAAFLGLAVLRAPKVLNAGLGARTRARLAEALRATRRLLPGQNNWLLFSAMVEAALFALGEDFDRVRVDYALRAHMGWYLGDGTYGDGPHFHWDYYNSIVIQPFLVAILEAVGEKEAAWKAMLPGVLARAERFTAVQERMIAPDGSYFVVGRSIAYRCGVFHLLADSALRQRLPEEVTPEQVRCGLAAVIRRTLTAEGTFDGAGWLRIGLAGHQPGLGESYISTGSLYLCANAFLPLGLPAEDRFWTGPDAAWSARKLWSGVDAKADHAMEG